MNFEAKPSLKRFLGGRGFPIWSRPYRFGVFFVLLGTFSTFFGIAGFFSWDFPDLSFLFLGLLKHLQGTVPKGSASGPFPKENGRPPGLRSLKLSGTKYQPKEEVLGLMSLRTSGRKLRSGTPNPGRKKQQFWHSRPAMTKLRSEELRVEEFLRSGVLGHPRVVSIQGWFLASPRKPPRCTFSQSKVQQALIRGSAHGIVFFLKA